MVERKGSGRASGYICQDAGKGHASGERDVAPAGFVAPHLSCSGISVTFESSLQTCLEVAGPHLQTTTSTVLESDCARSYSLKRLEQTEAGSLPANGIFILHCVN